MKRLLDRLLATRARRDREERLSAPWKAADTELHEIEKAIFRVPLDEPSLADRGGARLRPAPAGLRRHLRRATIGRPTIARTTIARPTIARTRPIEGQSAG